MRDTLDTQEPAAAEGGATTYQQNLHEEVWRVLCEVHAKTGHDNYSVEDIVKHVTDNWDSDEIEAPNRMGIIEAITLFETQQKRSNYGEFRRVRKGVYGFWQ